MNAKSAPGYGRSVLAFGCGYFLGGVVVSAYESWGLDWWSRDQSSGLQFEFLEGLLFVLLFGALAVASYFVGVIVRSRGLTSPDWASAGRAALFGVGCVAALWLIAWKAPTNRAMAVAVISAVPGCLGYLAGVRNRQVG